jgi:hypothetical protein
MAGNDRVGVKGIGVKGIEVKGLEINSVRFKKIGLKGMQLTVSRGALWKCSYKQPHNGRDPIPSSLFSRYLLSS